MPTFKDNKDREWELRIDAPSIMRIRQECDPKFLLEDSETENTYLRMQADPVLLCRTIFLLCGSQRNERGVSEEDFYMEVIGDAIDRATEALLAAIVNFTPPNVRKLLKAVAEKSAAIQGKAIQIALEKVNSPDVEEQMLAAIQGKIDADVEAALTRLGSATSSPGS